MSGVWYFWGSLALLMAGYLVYGSVVEKVFGADAKRPTPLKIILCTAMKAYRQ